MTPAQTNLMEKLAVSPGRIAYMIDAGLKARSKKIMSLKPMAQRRLVKKTDKQIKNMQTMGRIKSEKPSRLFGIDYDSSATDWKAQNFVNQFSDDASMIRLRRIAERYGK